MNFVSYAEMVEHIKDVGIKLYKFDMVCGVPRSGMIPAALLALQWNVPLTTPDLMKEGKHIGSGPRLHLNEVKRVLVVEDSVYSGSSMKNVKEALKDIKGVEIKYFALYGVHDSLKHVDYCYMHMSQPRFFEWNWLHHHNMMRLSCFDMDGVLCREPTNEENDYGPKYLEFLKNTEPKYIPSTCIGTIITGRLEQYRAETEEWLNRHNVSYNELIMRKDRTISIAHYKAENLLKLKGKLFIEDNIYQAETINKLTGLPVLCVTNWRLYQ